MNARRQQRGLVQQSLITKAQESSLEGAIGICLAELRTPLGAILGNAQLIAHKLSAQRNCLSLVDVIMQHSTIIAEQLLRDQLVDVQRLVIMRHRYRYRNVPPDEFIPPVRNWDKPLETALQEISQDIYTSTLHIQTSAQRLYDVYLDYLDSDAQDIILSIEHFAEQILAVISSLIDGVLIVRVRKEYDQQQT